MWLCVLGGGFAWHWRRRACCVCCVCLRACVLACCAHAHAAGAYCRHVLGPQNDTRHEYAKCSTSDAAEHASLLKLLSKLPPRIRRLTLRWDAMDMLLLQGQSGKHAYQMTKHRVYFFLACPGRRGACRRFLCAAAACMLAVIPITIPLSCGFICSWLSCPVHAKTEWKGLVPQICAFACTIDTFCCRCFLQIEVDRHVKDKPDQCVS